MIRKTRVLPRIALLALLVSAVGLLGASMTQLRAEQRYFGCADYICSGDAGCIINGCDTCGTDKRCGIKVE
jgi:hypothetical protein